SRARIREVRFPAGTFYLAGGAARRGLLFAGGAHGFSNVKVGVCSMRRKLSLACLTVLVVLLRFATVAIAQSETTLLAFISTNGASPYGGLTFDSKGSLYGTTTNGGTNGTGLVYRLIKNSRGQWKQSILYQFAPSGTNDGNDPQPP